MCICTCCSFDFTSEDTSVLALILMHLKYMRIYVRCTVELVCTGSHSIPWLSTFISHCPHTNSVHFTHLWSQCGCLRKQLRPATVFAGPTGGQTSPDVLCADFEWRYSTSNGLGKPCWICSPCSVKYNSTKTQTWFPHATHFVVAALLHSTVLSLSTTTLGCCCCTAECWPWLCSVRMTVLSCTVCICRGVPCPCMYVVESTCSIRQLPPLLCEQPLSLTLLYFTSMHVQH